MHSSVPGSRASSALSSRPARATWQHTWRCAGAIFGPYSLAVELGFERMAEVQEEILWPCEAARVPVIWATQVLERLAKEGVPTRAEVTDAAADRAGCVMLNKGPFIMDTVRVLDDVLLRMQAHQRKKSAQLRPLPLVAGFVRG